MQCFLKIAEKSLRCFVVSRALPCSKYIMKDQQLPFQNVRWYDNNTTCHCRSTSTYFHVLRDRSSHMKMYFKERQASDIKPYPTIPQIWPFWRDNIFSMLLPNRIVWYAMRFGLKLPALWILMLPTSNVDPGMRQDYILLPKKNRTAHPIIKLETWNWYI